MRALVLPLPGVLPVVSAARAALVLERAQRARDPGAPARTRDREAPDWAAATERGGSRTARRSQPHAAAPQLVSVLGQPKRRCCAGIAGSSPAAGPTATA